MTHRTIPIGLTLLMLGGLAWSPARTPDPAPTAPESTGTRAQWSPRAQTAQAAEGDSTAQEPAEGGGAASGGSDSAEETPEGQSAPPAPQQPPAVESPRTRGLPESDPSNPRVVLETTKGEITIELLPQQAPISVANFLAYVDEGFYDGTVFHRLIPNFMVQGGGFDTEGALKPAKPPIVNEAYNGLHNRRGTVSMARARDPNSATSQFFINLVDNRFLDQDKAHDNVGYAVFGMVVDGQDALDRIRRARVVNRCNDKEREDCRERSLPAEAIVIKSAHRLQ